MAIIDKLYLKNEYGEDVAYDIGANGSNVAFNENTSVNSKINDLNVAIGTQSTNLSNHTSSSVSSETGSHNLRYYNSTLQVKDGNTQEDVLTGDNVAAIPICTKKYVYNNSSQTPTFIGYDSNKMNASGLTAKTNAGTYEVIFTLKSGYKQEDGTTSSKTVTQTIEKGIPRVLIQPESQYGSSVQIEIKNSSFFIEVSEQLPFYVLKINCGSNGMPGDCSISGMLSKDIVYMEGIDKITCQPQSSSGSQVYYNINLQSSVNNALCYVGFNETENTKAVKYNVYISGFGSTHPAASWMTGTDAEITTIIKGYYGEGINYTLDEIKGMQAIGDKRTLSIGSITTSGTANGNTQSVGESHHAADYIYEIIDFNHDDLTTAVGGKTKALITVQQKECFRHDGCSDTGGSTNTECGYMNSTNTDTGGQTSCARRKWCNGGYYAALPSYIKSLIKPVNKLTSAGRGTEIINTDSDYCFFPSEIEVYGIVKLSKEGEGSQYTFYANSSSNRNKLPKYNSTSSSSGWQERSPCMSYSASFCGSGTSSNAGRSLAGSVTGIAPAFAM